MIALSSLVCKPQNDLSLNFKQSTLHCRAAACYAISKSHRQNFIKSFCKDFGFPVPNNRHKKPRILVRLPDGVFFRPKLLILHFVNVITKLCRRICSVPYLYSNRQMWQSCVQAPPPGGLCRQNLSVQNCRKFTILLCFLGEDGL